jgi:hypothetical protein
MQHTAGRWRVVRWVGMRYVPANFYMIMVHYDVVDDDNIIFIYF